MVLLQKSMLIENKLVKSRKPRGNQVFSISKIVLASPMDELQYFSAVIVSGDDKIVYITLNSDGTEIKDFGCTCKCNEVNASMKKPLIRCKHIKFFESVLILIGRYKPEDL